MAGTGDLPNERLRQENSRCRNASAKLAYAKTVFTSFAKQLDARTGILPGPVPSVAGPGTVSQRIGRAPAGGYRVSIREGVGKIQFECPARTVNTACLPKVVAAA